jgi:hypothetical protein
MHIHPYDEGHMNRRLAVIALLAVAATAAAHAAEILDNAAIIRLARAGLSTEIILLKIEQSEARFDVSTDALVELKTAGVADAVIKSMMMKTPAPAAHASAIAVQPPPATRADACAKVLLYALGNDGWAWVPASACVSATELSLDEQSFPFSALTVQCLETEARFAILGTTGTGDATWRFSDGKESFQVRGKPDEIHKLSDALVAAAPAVRHGKCSERGLKALVPRPPLR